MFDRRQHARREVSIEAQLFLRGQRPSIVPCEVVDLSEGGARVQIEIPCLLPPQVFLMMYERENIYECETAWQDEQQAGVMFVDLYAHARRQNLLKEIETAETVVSVPTPTSHRTSS